MRSNISVVFLSRRIATDERNRSRGYLDIERSRNADYAL